MFYIERIKIKNRAPFTDEIDLSFRESSVNILSAVNGKGKTTLLSYIMDSWVEMTRDAYVNSYEGKENNYYRVSSPLYDLNSSKPSFVYIRYKFDGQIIDYVDIRNNCTMDEYESFVKTIPNHMSFSIISKRLEKNNIVKFTTVASNRKLAHNIWDNNVVTYFPSYRHELPSFLNDCYASQVDYTTKSIFSNTLPNPLEVKCNIKGIVNWLMDVTIDAELYKKRQSTPQGNIDVTPENSLWKNVRSIIRKALVSKYPSGDVRLAISKRNSHGTRMSLTNNNGDITYCPTIYSLSSGELDILNIFVEILRQADNLQNNISLHNIHGIVLIDEIDIHLHIKLQKESLPELIQLFPNIQFIISSHSPFLNMGLADIEGADNRMHIFDLDNNAIESSPTNNQIYMDAYQLFLNEKTIYAEMYKSLEEKLKKLVRPLVITEGKTDIKHIIKAFEKLGVEVSFDTLPPNEQPDGWSNLDTMLVQLSKIHQSHKIIGIFDSDVDKPVKAYGFDGSWNNNNVYGFCIPVPRFRKDAGQDKISIEYLYTDEEIHSVLPDGTQLFFGNEFKKDSTRRCITNPELRLNERNGAGEDRIIENNGGQAVFDNNDNNHLGKKDTFADAIINEDIEISQESWENFRPIVELIQSIINS